MLKIEGNHVPRSFCEEEKDVDEDESKKLVKHDEEEDHIVLSYLCRRFGQLQDCLRRSKQNRAETEIVQLVVYVMIYVFKQIETTQL